MMSPLSSLHNLCGNNLFDVYVFLYVQVFSVYMTVQLSIQRWVIFILSCLPKNALELLRTSVCIVKMVTTMVIYSTESSRDSWFKLETLQVKYVALTKQLFLNIFSFNLPMFNKMYKDIS